MVTARLTLYKVDACSSTTVFYSVDDTRLYIPANWQGVARSARLVGMKTAVLYDANHRAYQNIAGNNLCARCVNGPFYVSFF